MFVCAYTSIKNKDTSNINTLICVYKIYTVIDMKMAVKQ